MRGGAMGELLFDINAFSEWLWGAMGWIGWVGLGWERGVFRGGSRVVVVAVAVA